MCHIQSKILTSNLLYSEFSLFNKHNSAELTVTLYTTFLIRGLAMIVTILNKNVTSQLLLIFEKYIAGKKALLIKS